MNWHNSTPPSFDDWLQTPMGEHVGSWAQTRLNDLVANVFGFNALQVGMESYDFLANNRMRNKYLMHCPQVLANHQVDTDNPSNLAADDLAYSHTYTDPQAPLKDGQEPLPPSTHHKMIANPEQLPFVDEYLDLIVLPFILEQSNNPHQVLREVERVLVHEGRIIIIGFNPNSLWGLRSLFPGQPHCPIERRKQLSIRRLKDWFCLLSLELDRGEFACYEPACRTKKWLNRWDFMNKAGNRWWPSYGSIYLLSATKRIASATLVGAPWRAKKETEVSENQIVVNRKQL